MVGSMALEWEAPVLGGSRERGRGSTMRDERWCQAEGPQPREERVRSHRSFTIVILHSFHKYEHFVSKEWSDLHLTKSLRIGHFRTLGRAELVHDIDRRSFLDNLCAEEWIWGSWRG